MFRHALTRSASCRLAAFRGPIWPRASQKAWTVSRKAPRVTSRHLANDAVLSGFQLATRAATRLPLEDDTVYALSSGSGRCGIAVIRISGSGCLDVYAGLCPTKPLPKPRHAVVRTLVEPGRETGENVVDSDALVLYFPGPKSVTGEDVLELHVHGGSATVKAVLGAIPKSISRQRVRYAEPGEFTRRAFLNNRLDLAQVESLGDTLAAETEQQRRAAVRGTSGVLGKTYESWREQLLLARGEIEALIDFSEDQHFDESPTELLSNVTVLVRDILRSIRTYQDGSQRSELLRNGIRIALLGPPNVGKSSLMNLIVGREASIVSAEAGTTRDIIEASLDIRGYLCSFADTAGIRTHVSPRESRPGAEPSGIGAIEQEGIRRARKKAQDSEVIIVLASVEPTTNGQFRLHYDTETLRLAADAQQCLIVINKCDAVDSNTLASLVHDFKVSVLGHIVGLGSAEPLTISCRAAESPTVGLTDPGQIHALTQRLVQSFSALTSLPDDMQHLLGVTERQNQLLEACKQSLEDFMVEAESCGQEGEPDVVLAAEHLRLAANHLAAITGRGDAGDVEDVLGVIFEK
ncbi:GTP-binding protein TrmE N-terminus-domain-containing protein [Cercophora newfieldiana]|uniref:GTP-binding protein TrmE N-terminus-domain-containing protein n=1 Tax=Cercophora newfieldiana TaxID=92897 RepID=A0AA40CUD2_9PEZI|nr:GTP-binding protein TrmE N-terminus-domain-containing protein [Cercophora newfieldiana]